MTDPYVVRSSPGEGLGCFATTTILPGTLLLRETPLFSVPEPRSNSAVTAAFSRLASVQQEQYLTLYAQGSASQGDDRVIDIFNSNAWQTGSNTSICPRAARFNHSCIPNASFAWNSNLSQITVHAITTIPAGAQIYLSYERPYQTLASRRKKLAAYGFVCTCRACDSDATASDIRRASMVLLDARIRSGRRQLWRSPVPKAALALVKLLKEEGLVGEALGLAYHDAAVGWKKYGRLDLAIQCATRELEVASMCFGADSPAVDATYAFLVALKLEHTASAVKSGPCD